MKAAGKSSNDGTGASGAESEDIAKLLRALNEDLKHDPADDDIADLDDEVEPKAERHLPFGKIAAALVAAAGVGFAVVMLDQEEAPTAPPVQAVAPLITAAPAPGGSSIGASGANAPAAPTSAAKVTPSQPEALIARAPAPSAVPPALPPAVETAPPSSQQPSPPPALKVPEPPPPAPVQTVTAPRPPAPEPVAKLPEPPPPSLAVKAPEPVKTEPVKAEPPPAKPAEPVKTAKAETPELQAMLAPKAAKRAPAEPKAQTASVDESAVDSAAPAASAPSGRYAVQLGSFHVAENAEALVRKLQGSGYRAYALDWTDASQQSWRVVRVGGFGDSAAAKRVANQLKAKVGLDPVVVSTR
nr:SPOR domain-containing protein [Azospirillum soli]